MRRISYIIAILFLSISCRDKSKTGEIAHTTSTQKTINKDDLGNWTINNYLDEFNDKTGKQYIALKAQKGIFNSSSTTNSNLTVIIMADTSFIEIKLFEYGGRYQTKTEGNVIFKIKEGNGDMYNIKTSGGYTFCGKPYTSDSLLRAILSRGGYIKFNSTITKYGNESNYNFIINADHFQDALSKIKNTLNDL